jgi:primary-amine oxidase
MRHFITNLLCSVALVSATAVPPLGYERYLLKEAAHKRQAATTCGDDTAPYVKAPKQNVWSGISAADNKAVWNLLHDPATGLNLTLPAKAKQTDNYVFWIDALHTNKTDVLPYLDASGPAPAKYARAIVCLNQLSSTYNFSSYCSIRSSEVALPSLIHKNS